MWKFTMGQLPRAGGLKKLYPGFIVVMQLPFIGRNQYLAKGGPRGKAQGFNLLIAGGKVVFFNVLVICLKKELKVGSGGWVGLVQEGGARFPLGGFGSNAIAVTGRGTGWNNNKEASLKADKVADVCTAQDAKFPEGRHLLHNNSGGKCAQGICLADAFQLFVQVAQNFGELLQLLLDIFAAVQKQLADLLGGHLGQLPDLFNGAGELAVKRNVTEVAYGANIGHSVVVLLPGERAEALFFVVADSGNRKLEQLGNLAYF